MFAKRGGGRAPKSLSTADSTAPAQRPAGTITTETLDRVARRPAGVGQHSRSRARIGTPPGQTRGVASTEPPATETSAVGERSVVLDTGSKASGDTLTAGGEGGSGQKRQQPALGTLQGEPRPELHARQTCRRTQWHGRRKKLVGSGSASRPGLVERASRRPLRPARLFRPGRLLKLQW